MTPSCLAIRGLGVETTRHGAAVRLVDDVSLEVRAGETLALVGASGCGKSLTCAASLDAAPPGVRRTAGSIAIDGVEQAPADIRGRLVATILQNPRSAFNPVRTMRQHAMEGPAARGVPASGRAQRIRVAMADAGLEDADRILALHPFEMSGGMLQRMMIALALASGAPFLFADEPTTDLDLIVQRDILDLLLRLTREQGLGVLLVTHDMGVVAALADRVAVMDAGRIVETGAVMDIFHRPAHPVTRGLRDAHLSLYRDRSAA
ncbi:ATP-binding cassette domain-containing protein [Camelimonas lactis]|uniref:Nickel transport system ATP-binding protein n=1 Tax=Camelimonas lactis TaxID=659006 RepID=A0A4R2GSP9_9HYPH|nr:nickel transport system ATP-binding protein [Camelimonas lactis]